MHTQTDFGAPFGADHYDTFGSLPAQEALDEIARLAKAAKRKNESRIVMFEQRVKHGSLRYHTFRRSGLKCVSCDRVGTVMLLQRVKGAEHTGCHFNLYAADGMLMTKDHIIPRFHGGKDIIENMQTMCQECNAKKGHTVEVDVPCAS